jgi:hypothetical protein
VSRHRSCQDGAGSPVLGKASSTIDKISKVRIQTGSYVATLSDEASQQLRGRLLAVGLESLFRPARADLEPGAIIALDQPDKRPLLDVVEAWIEGAGEEQLSPTGILHLREGLRVDLARTR